MKCCMACLTDVVLLALCGVFSTCGPRRSPECHKYDAFLELGPTDQQRLEFLKHPLDEQVEIYICAWYSEPAPRYLADVIADRGEAALPVLRKRLNEEPKEYSQKAIVYAFSVMGSKGYLRGRRDLLDEIRAKVSSMKDEHTRRSSQEFLDEIELQTMK